MDYAADGLIGVVTPQANCNVEAELRVLLPPSLGIAVARMTSNAESMRDRLIAYFRDLDSTLDRFENAPLSAIGVGCTGSSYLIEPEEDKSIFDRVTAARGAPVLSTATAIDAALRHVGARRIALVSPYSDWLTDAARAHWTRAGYEVTAVEKTRPVEGYHAIYAQPGIAGYEAARRLPEKGYDAVVISGTGMPSLAAIAALCDAGDIPVLSSNFTLGWLLLNRIGWNGGNLSYSDWLAGAGGWRERLSRDYPATEINL
ncbi:MAG: hypothetical protein RIC36_00345 [Rhodospirillales bacterium]